MDQFLEFLREKSPAAALNLEQGNIIGDVQLKEDKLYINVAFAEAEKHFKEMLKINPTATIADRLISRYTKYNQENTHFKEMIEK